MSMSRKIITIGSAVAVIAAIPTAAYASNEDTSWTDMRVMNMAHSGGELEAPTNTMYAFKKAAAVGTDMLELDVQSTADDELIVMHNATVDDTTNGSGEVEDMTTQQVQALDAAYNFVPGLGTVPGEPDDSYQLRGMRTGEQPPPSGYSADDFAIPTLTEVFAQFPSTAINIEIKGSGTTDVASFQHNAKLLAEFLNESGRTDVIVTSFNDLAVSKFHDLAPKIGLAPGMTGLSSYALLGKKPIEGTVAIQIPVKLKGVPIAMPSFIERAHNDGYAVHVWFSGSATEDAALYNELVDACADALMTARPQLFEQILDDRDIVRPGQPGSDPCE